MPLFSVLGGLVVFAWSRRLYGIWGGLLSLALWVFCPNVLAHARLITSDMGSTALGVAATYRLLALSPEAELAVGDRRGDHARTGAVDQVQHALALCGLAVPVAGAGCCSCDPRQSGCRAFRSALAHGLVIVASQIVTIDAGYLFEGVGIPLGKFEFGSPDA